MQLSTLKLENVKESKGIVRGTMIYSEKYMDSFKSSLELKKGGFLDLFTNSTDNAIGEAVDKMTADASDKQANAIEGIRINIQNIVSGSNDFITAVTVYGMAVVVSITPSSRTGLEP